LFCKAFYLAEKEGLPGFIYLGVIFFQRIYSFTEDLLKNPNKSQKNKSWWLLRKNKAMLYLRALGPTIVFFLLLIMIFEIKYNCFHTWWQLRLGDWHLRNDTCSSFAYAVYDEPDQLWYNKIHNRYQTTDYTN
jgi:hypothetical protein